MAGHGDLADQPLDEPYAGVRRYVVDGDRATLVRYVFAPGVSFPRHAHEEEQITLVEEGSIDFALGETSLTLGPGGWVVVESGVEHGVTAGPDGAQVLGVIAPRRVHRDAYRVAPAR